MHVCSLPFLLRGVSVFLSDPKSFGDGFWGEGIKPKWDEQDLLHLGPESQARWMETRR